MLICIVIAIGHLIMFTDSHRLFPSWISSVDAHSWPLAQLTPACIRTLDSNLVYADISLHSDSSIQDEAIGCRHELYENNIWIVNDKFDSLSIVHRRHPHVEQKFHTSLLFCLCCRLKSPENPNGCQPSNLNG